MDYIALDSHLRNRVSTPRNTTIDVVPHNSFHRDINFGGGAGSKMKLYLKSQLEFWGIILFVSFGFSRQRDWVDLKLTNPNFFDNFLIVCFLVTVVSSHFFAKHYLDANKS